jgi:hypothetical protein
MKTLLRISSVTATMALFLSAAASRAGTVAMDFDHLAAAGANNTITSPQNEDGLRITNSNDFYIFGPGSGRNTGHKALANQFTNTLTTLSAQNGAKFTLVSMRLSPYSSGSDSTVTFTGNKAGGGTVTTSLTTGTAIAGVVRTFPSTFQDVVSVTWNMSALNTYHQFDDITAILTPELTVTPSQTVTENSGSVTVGVRLSEPLPAPVSLQWTANSGTATAVQDFGAGGTTGTFTVPAGQTSATVNIGVVNDTAVESLEEFTVSFTTTSQTVVFASSGNTTTVRIASEDGITGFPGWMSAHGLAGNGALPDADPNGDGVKNIEAWLFRINPAGPSPASWLDRRAVFLIDGVNRPALRFTVPTALPSDVRIIFEESTGLSTPWSEQTRRTGFGLGSLWTGTGSSRVTETNAITGRTVTCAGSVSTRSSPRAFLRLKYDYVSGGGNT